MTFTGSIDALQTQTMVRFDTLEELMRRLLADTQRLMGWLDEDSAILLEMEYRNRYAARFARVATRLRTIDQTRLSSLIPDAVERGLLTPDEGDDLLQTDIILEGRRRSDNVDVFLAVEVSWGIHQDDIERAERRSRIVAKLGKPGVAVVAGKWMDSMLEPVARAHGVWCVLNGSTRSPEGLLTA